MAKAPTGVALLLVGMVTVARHVARLATVVAALLALLLGLLAVSGDVPAPATVVARYAHRQHHKEANSKVSYMQEYLECWNI